MKQGKPLLNRELAALPDGSLVWVVFFRDGRKKWDEALKIYREKDGSYSLLAPDTDRATWGSGEYFVSDVSTDPNEQAARDVRGGMFLYHVI